MYPGLCDWCVRETYVYVHTMEYYWAIKRDDVMPFPATWDYHTTSERERQISNGITYMWNWKKNDTNEHIYKIETDSQTQKTNLWLPKEEAGGGGIHWEFGITDIHYYI